MTDSPLILAFDTSAAHCAAALVSGDTLLASRTEEMGRGQAERLMPLLEELLAGAGRTWGDLAAIAVGEGPGNFTGIRIAVAAARGLALGLKVPAIGVTSFDALRAGLDRPALAAVAAPRGAVYLQAPGATPLGPLMPEDMPGDLHDSGLPVVGAEAEVLAALTAGPSLATACPIAEGIARTARSRLGLDAPLPRPLYVRPADAAPSRDLPPVLLDE
ncbi:tRNA (adenosine(37)-N6)-threonylcarbamoyltransferase complex dimerization subunit type 1 TsaB [Pseudodonghicola flavimaris]|uniref:tRNA (Adenosine(37)-N6)-threonylcarbamoyltransferase complex dimerization subunit type 1 TsaB n=1 Tax=Pseudodonghicola flavimaris TaxID=3050036 RepID=A0ABT7F4M5_9RHOB|nr:tRNA (adenosine(37)-N6)-threonylcarbamoyltransferase complex dimerization subunit type 1 TsaB [Pseudodonghicola flavimaris]MDK3019567.1 tRNA (adenosine(37)-N6)-threonylcarbamoyltransferase complex dimerization subunit type 1 TsaB [Pseudodonghicola flavimaris]